MNQHPCSFIPYILILILNFLMELYFDFFTYILLLKVTLKREFSYNVNSSFIFVFSVHLPREYKIKLTKYFNLILNSLSQSSGKRGAALATRRPSTEKPRGSLMYDTNLEEAPHEIRELLGGSHQWDFDIIKLESLTEKR